MNQFAMPRPAFPMITVWNQPLGQDDRIILPSGARFVGDGVARRAFVPRHTSGSLAERHFVRRGMAYQIIPRVKSSGIGDTLFKTLFAAQQESTSGKCHLRCRDRDTRAVADGGHG
jgi:hypothetical protein